MTTRIRLTAAEVKAKWMDDDATGLIHDHQTLEVVVVMLDGTEYACPFEEHERMREDGSRA
jgi:hypothetical protein